MMRMLFLPILSQVQFTELVTMKHWSCKEIAELGQKFTAEKRLSDTVVIEGRPCPKSELARYFLAILDKILEKCDKEGCAAVPREELDRIAALHEALKEELTQYEGYQTRREAIEKMLAKPEVPAFVYKIGVGGFSRDASGSDKDIDYGYLMVQFDLSKSKPRMHPVKG